MYYYPITVTTWLIFNEMILPLPTNQNVISFTALRFEVRTTCRYLLSAYRFRLNWIISTPQFFLNKRNINICALAGLIGFIYLKLVREVLSWASKKWKPVRELISFLLELFSLFSFHILIFYFLVYARSTIYAVCTCKISHIKTSLILALSFTHFHSIKFRL